MCHGCPKNQPILPKYDPDHGADKLKRTSSSSCSPCSLTHAACNFSMVKPVYSPPSKGVATIAPPKASSAVCWGVSNTTLPMNEAQGTEEQSIQVMQRTLAVKMQRVLSDPGKQQGCPLQQAHLRTEGANSRHLVLPGGKKSSVHQVLPNFEMLGTSRSCRSKV